MDIGTPRKLASLNPWLVEDKNDRVQLKSSLQPLPVEKVAKESLLWPSAVWAKAYEQD